MCVCVNVFVCVQAMSSPLHVATRTGHADVVDFLISNGAKINAKDRVGQNAAGARPGVTHVLHKHSAHQTKQQYPCSINPSANYNQIVNTVSVPKRVDSL